MDSGICKLIVLLLGSELKVKGYVQDRKWYKTSELTLILHQFDSKQTCGSVDVEAVRISDRCPEKYSSLLQVLTDLLSSKVGHTVWS